MGIQVLFLEGTRCCSLWPWRRQDILQKESDFARLPACPPALLPGQKLLAWQRGSVPVPGLVSSALCRGDNEPWNSPDQHPLTTPGRSGESWVWTLEVQWVGFLTQCSSEQGTELGPMCVG